jgi:hydrogenase maturation protein HypF
VDRAQWRVLRQMLAQNLNSPRSSAMGRAFDAVAAMLGVRDEIRYEAQAAIELEMLADADARGVYPFALVEGAPRVLDFDPTLRAIVGDLLKGVAPATIAGRFHNTVARAVAEVCAALRSASALDQVALGGGVFQNALVLERTVQALQTLDFRVRVPRNLPPNDGCIAYGQAVIANAQRMHK